MSPRISPRHDLCFKSEMKVSNGSRVGLLPSCQPDHSGGPVVRAEECCRLPGLRVELLDKTLNFRKRLPGGEELRLPALPGHDAPLRLGDLGFPKVETELFARLGERLSDGFDSYRLIFMGSALIADLGGSPPIRSAHRNPDELHLHSASEVERDLLRSEASGANERHQEARTEISCEPGGEISGWHWIERVLYQQFHVGKNQNQGAPEAWRVFQESGLPHRTVLGARWHAGRNPGATLGRHRQCAGPCHGLLFPQLVVLLWQ